MDILLRLMERVDFFSGFTPEEKRIIAENDSFFATFEDGEPIVKEGESHDKSLVILISGQAVVTKKDNPNQILRRLEEGELFGEATFLTGRPRSAQVTALGRVTTFEMSRSALDGLECSLQIKIRDFLIELLVRRIEDIEAREVKKP